MSGDLAPTIQMIPVDQIHVLNPRSRNKRIFHQITHNILQIGLKRPITVTTSKSGTPGKPYDLVCGQGRLEAFLACDQKEIPALIVEADEHETLVMSLVENLARRQHRALDLMQGIETLKDQGYTIPEIAQKTGLTKEYVVDISNLMERGEERLLSAVEAGQIPINIAMKIASAPEQSKDILQEAYNQKQLRGKKFNYAQRLIELRQRHGKVAHGGSRRKQPTLSAASITKAYQEEARRKVLMVKKAAFVNHLLVFSVEALRRLLEEDHFRTLLRAEKLNSPPKDILKLIEGKGPSHG